MIKSVRSTVCPTTPRGYCFQAFAGFGWLDAIRLRGGTNCVTVVPVPTLDSTTIVRLLAAPERRRVVAALILEPADTASIASRADLTVRQVTDAVARLHMAGLCDVDRDGCWYVLETAFEIAARTEAPSRPPSAHPDEPDDVAQVLDAAFSDGRLVHWPKKRARRLIVLDKIAQLFEPGVRYSERQVNAMLVAITDDTAGMRRWLIDQSFLDRANGEYWRSGGSV